MSLEKASNNTEVLSFLNNNKMTTSILCKYQDFNASKYLNDVIKSIKDQDLEAFLLVAKDNNTICGIIIHMIEGTWSSTELLSIATNYQNQKLETLLLNKAEKIAEAKGAKTHFLRFPETTTGAMQFAKEHKYLFWQNDCYMDENNNNLLTLMCFAKNLNYMMQNFHNN